MLLVLLLLTLTTSVWSSFEHLFPDSLQDFSGCPELDKGVCQLLAATNKQITLLHNVTGSAVGNPPCSYREKDGHTLHKYATQPSPGLTKLLDMYMTMHRSCIASEYNRLSDVRYRPRCRYVVWSCQFGLGNRLMSLVSTFLYAILTQRVLLVDNPGWEKLFCEPFPGSTWLVPRGMKDFSHDASFKSSFSVYYDKRQSFDTPRVVPVAFRSSTGVPELRFLVCPSALASVRDVPFINVQNSNQYFAPGFFLNPILRPVLESLFPERRVFHHLGRFLLNPSDQVWSNIVQIHDSSLRNARRRIGVQIRESKGQYTSYYDTTVPLCILEKTGICPLEERNQTGAELDIAVYIATLLSGHESKINESLSNTTLRYSIGRQKPDGVQLDDPTHQQKALTDMWLLSLSDVLLTTGMSTFGYTAQALAGITPYRLTHWPTNPCIVAVSSDPCFHFAPPKEMKCLEDGFELENEGSRGVNYVWPCRDFAGTGIQLAEP